MIQIFKNVLDDETKIKLNKICANFDNENYEKIDSKMNNFYKRLILDKSLLLAYLNNCEQLLKENLSADILKNINFEDVLSCINKVTNETNKNDQYHYDISYLTIVTYLNDNFEGGEFLYKEGQTKIEIKPEKNMTLVMNNRLSHKVMPVHNGTRFSLITFFQLKEKTNKTLG
jgi:Rps23 Pro-64 3,4-dihydroxylase Tpa1-like proline 4-hydroxylase